MNKTIIYEDLHGCLTEFKELRAKVNPTKNDKENPINLDKQQQYIYNNLSSDDFNPIAKLWSEYYNGNQGIIVYGHNVFNEVRFDKYSIGIDTSCVYGGKLTALIISDTSNPLENHKITSTQAKEEYTINKIKKI